MGGTSTGEGVVGAGEGADADAGSAPPDASASASAAAGAAAAASAAATTAGSRAAVSSASSSPVGLGGGETWPSNLGGTILSREPIGGGSYPGSSSISISLSCDSSPSSGSSSSSPEGLGGGETTPIGPASCTITPVSVIHPIRTPSPSAVIVGVSSEVESGRYGLTSSYLAARAAASVGWAVRRSWRSSMRRW